MLRAFYLVWLTLLVAAPLAQAQSYDDPGFVPVFDGNDLAGWQVIGPADWHAANGILWTDGQGGWLRSQKPYADFVWRLEYRVSPGADSGILLRAAAQGEPALTGLEIQILDDAGKPPNLHSTGAIYDAAIPLMSVAKPAGEWNQVEISCIGRQLIVFLNGNRIQKVGLNDPAFQFIPAHPLGRVPNVGYIGLQSRNGRVDFRNLHISVLKPAP